MFSISIVPTGLTLNLMHNPGTEVPGYFHFVPPGRKMAKRQRPEGPACARRYVVLNSWDSLIAGVGLRLKCGRSEVIVDSQASARYLEHDRARNGGGAATKDGGR